MGYREPDKYDFGLGGDEERPSIRTSFAQQFEDDASGVVFYRGGIGRPVRVTDQERIWAIDEWERRHPLIWQVGVALGIGWLIFVFTQTDWPQTQFAILIGLAGIGGAVLAAHTWLSHRTTRQFRGRTPSGPHRSRWTMLKSRSDQFAWSKLGLSAALVVASALFKLESDRPLAVANFLLELGGGTAVFVLTAVKLAAWWDDRWGAKRIG